MIFYSIINKITFSTKEINKIFYNKEEAEEFVCEVNRQRSKVLYGLKEFEFEIDKAEIERYTVKKSLCNKLNPKKKKPICSFTLTTFPDNQDA